MRLRSILCVMCLVEWGRWPGRAAETWEVHDSCISVELFNPTFQNIFSYIKYIKDIYPIHEKNMTNVQCFVPYCIMSTASFSTAVFSLNVKGAQCFSATTCVVCDFRGRRPGLWAQTQWYDGWVISVVW